MNTPSQQAEPTANLTRRLEALRAWATGLRDEAPAIKNQAAILINDTIAALCSTKGEEQLSAARSWRDEVIADEAMAEHRAIATQTAAVAQPTVEQLIAEELCAYLAGLESAAVHHQKNTAEGLGVVSGHRLAEARSDVEKFVRRCLATAAPVAQPSAEPVKLKGYSCNYCGRRDIVRDDPAGAGEPAADEDQFKCRDCGHTFNCIDETERPRDECPVCGGEAGAGEQPSKAPHLDANIHGIGPDVGGGRNPKYEGCFDGETHKEAYARRAAAVAVPAVREPSERDLFEAWFADLTSKEIDRDHEGRIELAAWRGRAALSPAPAERGGAT